MLALCFLSCSLVSVALLVSNWLGRVNCCSAFLLARHARSQDLHTFNLGGTTAWHTLLGGMFNSNSQTLDVFTSSHKMAEYTTCTARVHHYAHARINHGVKMAD